MVSATPWCARSHPHTGTSSTRLVLREPSPQTGPPKHRAELPKTLSSVKSAAYKTGCEISGLTPLDRVAGLRGRRFAGCIDLLADGLYAGEIEHRRRCGARAVLHANAKLDRIGHEAQQPRGISAQGGAMSPGRRHPSFLHFGLAIDAVRDLAVITSQRIPRSDRAA